MIYNFVFAKFRSVRVAYHHPPLMGNYLTLYSHVSIQSIQWMACYLSVFDGVLGMSVVAVVFDKNRLKVKRKAHCWAIMWWVFIWRYGTLDVWRGWRFILFMNGLLNLLQVCDSERVCCEKSVGLQSVGKRTQKFHKDKIKSGGDIEPPEIDKQCLDALCKWSCCNNWVYVCETGLERLWGWSY